LCGRKPPFHAVFNLFYSLVTRSYSKVTTSWRRYKGLMESPAILIIETLNRRVKALEPILT